MNFSLDDDQAMLRESARVFLDKEISLAPLLVPGATNARAGADATWRKITELGWQGLVIPEEYGGSGLSCVDLVMILGEMGRTLAPCPFLGNLAGTWAVLRAGSAAQKLRLLPRVATGDMRLALAVPGAHGEAGDGAVRAEADGAGWRLDGTVGFVVDALGADALVVAAQGGDGRRGLYVVTAGEGVAVTPLDWQDITRQVSAVTLRGARAELLAADDAAHWPWIRDRLLLALAAENAAGLRHVLDTTAAYAKERVAFGRPIGAYQAIKHALADMMGTAECAAVAVLYAAWTLSHDAPEGTEAAAIAKAYTSEAYVAAVRRNVQVFGAIGFTWEMANHLYFKRALGNAELYGNPRHHRSRVIDLAQRKAA